jgi:hypothetical protein
LLEQGVFPPKPANKYSSSRKRCTNRQIKSRFKNLRRSPDNPISFLVGKLEKESDAATMAQVGAQFRARYLTNAFASSQSMLRYPLLLPPRYPQTVPAQPYVPSLLPAVPAVSLTLTNPMPKQNPPPPTSEASKTSRRRPNTGDPIPIRSAASVEFTPSYQPPYATVVQPIQFNGPQFTASEQV